MAKAKDSYVPGVCNINSEEIAYRRKSGRVGLLILFVLLIILLFLHISYYFRLILFLPALLAATGYLQSKNKFCVGYASAGLQNANEGSTEAKKITSKEYLALDKKKSRSINNKAFLIALGVTFICYFLPRF